MPGVQRQHALQSLQQVDDDEAGEIEDEHRQRVALPVLLLGRVHPTDAVDDALERASTGLSQVRSPW